MKSSTSTQDDNRSTSASGNRPFRRLGDAYHLNIANDKDLEAVLTLDEAHWVATTAPTNTINTDSVFLNLVDSDCDGRLRAEEVKDAIRFLLRYHKKPEDIRDGNLTLDIDAINPCDESGQQIRESANKVLARLSDNDKLIPLAQLRKIKNEVLDGGLDQAGIVLPEATTDKDIHGFINDLVKSVGGKQHPQGKHGADTETLNTFMDECQRFLTWRLEAGALNEEGPSKIWPLGTKTASLYPTFELLHKKFIQYFLLCDLKRINPELLASAMNTPEGNIASNLMDSEHAEAYLSNAPLAQLNDEGVLDLTGEMNPYFKKNIETFLSEIAQPLLSSAITHLDKHTFQSLLTMFNPYLDWLDRKPQVSVECVDFDTMARYVNDSKYRQQLELLIAESHRTAFVLENLKELERLLLYQGHLLGLVNSFVSFPHLYDPNSRALFEMGTLIMDGRHFTLAVTVNDRKRHIEVVKSSNIFMMYLELYGPGHTLEYEVAVPITSGNHGNIHLGKWGIFNDIHGRELHAQIVDIVENPISIGEAMIDPFVRLGRSFINRLEEFSSKAEQQLFKSGDGDKDKKKDGSSGGLLAGGGIAIAAIGSSFAFITETLAGLSLKVILIALGITAALIAIPAAIATYYRLSRRDLSTILEGSGWGLNARMRLTREQANTFTLRPPYHLEQETNPESPK
ncbi:MAG: hypothetical protein DHS20C01_32910 [marine bacterium B5-7]|nr:MAG: hypothetical protein DHS20C01_32910 [marine bacterium B5-7]